MTESLGPEYSEMLILDLDVTWSESEPRTPLVCILSIGSDPTTQIATLAKNKNISSYCFCIIMSGNNPRKLYHFSVIICLQLFEIPMHRIMRYLPSLF